MGRPFSASKPAAMTASVARAPLFAPAVPAALALADGTVFRGRSIGAAGHATGEVVFNTAMTGYQEILTDPSYAGQIVTLTYPHIGNAGVNPRGREVGAASSAAGLVIRDLPLRRLELPRDQTTCRLPGRRQRIVGIADIDTRKLTRILREKGAQAGCLVAGDALDDATIADAVRRARRFPGLAGHGPGQGRQLPTSPTPGPKATGRSARATARRRTPRFHVVAYDFGVKRNILRMLAARGCRLTVVPAQTPAAAVLALQPDGVFLSNGPGDPEPCDYAIAAIREIVDAGMPTFGICLGHQLLGLASGARTVKMKFGHHGANHPVQGSRHRPGA